MAAIEANPVLAEQEERAATRRWSVGGIALDLLTIVYFIFALFPLVWMLLLSLKTPDQLFTTYFRFTPTLDSYRAVLGLDASGSVPFVRFFINSLIVSFGAVLISLLVGVPAAYAFARYQFKGGESLLFTLLSFRFAPELMVIIPIYVIYQRIGLFDTHLGLIWVYQLITLPLIVWILRSYFQDLTPELEQSALLDGYSRPQAFVKVALPLVKPGMAAAALLAFIFAWNSFIFPFILTGSNAQTVTVGALSFMGGATPRYNLTAAAALIALIPPLLLALSIQRYLVRGLTFGAVKG
ncbi:MAG: carbohydrate ABC transporter permease [Thermomicrobiales bacterium]|nr:carbohydrate ABC transporter permease [Thermomicrobiales bacterium]